MITSDRKALLIVNRIQRFCLNDGPGIRSTVFCQGCDLRCWWCHNPETRWPTSSPDAVAYAPGDLADLLERDARYWRQSNGGVTFSGGEPLFQPEPLVACLRAIGERSQHRAVDTAGAAPLDVVQTVAPHIDLWLWDIKSADPRSFSEHTLGDLDQVLINLRWVLDQTPTPVRLRVPIIAGVNDSEADIAQIVELVGSLSRAVEVEPLAGHDLGRAAVDRAAAVDSGRFAAVLEQFRRAGVPLIDHPNRQPVDS